MLVQDRYAPAKSQIREIRRFSEPKSLDFSTWVSENLSRIVIISLSIVTILALFFLYNTTDTASLLCFQTQSTQSLQPLTRPQIKWNSIRVLPDKTSPYSTFVTEKWIVVSVTNYPTEELKGLVKIKGWQVLAVGNSLTPKDWSLKGSIFLSLDAQAELGYRVLDHLPYDSFVRKSVGYLFAIQHGANKIYDADDRGEVIGGDLGKCFDVDPKPKCRPLFPSQHLTNRVVKLEEGMKYFYHQDGSNPSDENSALVHYIQVHRDEFAMNIKLQLFGLVAKQPTFHQLRTVEQLGYITALAQRNDSGIYGVQFIIQSSVKGPGHIDSRVELLLKNFETKLREMSDEEFKSNVTALIDMKLEKYKNLKEESRFYWQEIQRGTLKFNRKEAEVGALRQLQKQELIDFFEEYIKIGAAKKKSLSIRVYGSQHLNEMASDKDEVPSPSVEIEDIVGFRKAQPLHGSFRGCGQPKL